MDRSPSLHVSLHSTRYANDPFRNLPERHGQGVLEHNLVTKQIQLLCLPKPIYRLSLATCVFQTTVPSTHGKRLRN